MSGQSGGMKRPAWGVRWTRGLVGREVRASASLLVTLGLTALAGPWAVALAYGFSQDGFRLPSSDALAGWWGGSALVVMFLLGVLCGAEEEENGTALWVRTLPLSPLRILFEKILGTTVAFGLWAVATLLLTCLQRAVLGEGAGESLLSVRWIFLNSNIPSCFTWGIVFYGCGLAAGAWTGRVLPGAVVGGLLAVALLFPLLAWVQGAKWENAFRLHGRWIWQPSSSICVVALMATALRSLTRGGVGWLRRKHQDLCLEGKDWHERKWLLAGLTLTICCVAPVWQRSADWFVELFLAVALSLSSVFLGTFFLSKYEHDPISGLLYHLPVSRSKIWREKTVVLVCQWVLLTSVIVGVWMTQELWGAPQRPAIREPKDFESLLFAVPVSLALLLFTAAISLHFRSVIITLVAAPLLFVPAGVLASVGILASVKFAMVKDPFLLNISGILGLELKAFLFAASLAAWLWFVFARTRLQECPPLGRLGLAVLFAVGLAEFYGIIFMCNLRELVFALFGV